MKLSKLLLRNASLLVCLALTMSSTSITTVFADSSTNSTPPSSSAPSTSNSNNNTVTVTSQTYLSPEIDRSFAPVFPTIKEGSTLGDNGTAVSTLVGNSITVNRSGGQAAIAVIGTTGSGTWEMQYSANGTWWNISPGGNEASNTNATMIRPGEKIRFRPAVNWNGTATITYRAWDMANDPGANQSTRTILDVSTNGADTNYSAQTQTASIVVTPVNTPPNVIFPITPKTLTFDGSTKYINMPAVDLPSNFTFETWVKSSNPSSTWNRIFDFGNGEASSNIFLGYENNSGKMILMSYRGSSGLSLTTSNVFPTNTWVHVATVIDAQGNASIYWDGVLQASGNIGVTEQITRTKNFVGRSNWAQDAYFQGQLRDIRMWNVARTAQQINDGYKNLLSGKEANLFTYLPAIEGKGTVLSDTSGHSNSADIIGAQWVDDLSVPPTSTMLQNTNSSTDLNGTKVTDVDFNETPNATMTVTLDTYNGVVNVDTSTSGVTVVQGGNNQASITLSGSMAQINQALLPLQYVPNHNFNGIDKLNFTVNDQGNTGEGGPMTAFKTVYLNVIPVNQDPTISAVADQHLFVNQSTKVLPFTVSDFETDANALTVTVTSSDTQFVPISGIVLGGSGASRTVKVTPTLAATGSSTITLTVSDGKNTKSTTFVVSASVDLDGSLGIMPTQGPLTKSPGDVLPLDAISSIQTDRVVALVDGKQVELTLANPTTYAQDGFKEWKNTTYALPATISSGVQTVVFQGLSTNGTITETEKNKLLQNNTFLLLKTPVANTTQASAVSTSGATLDGTATEDGGTPITERGFVYATNNQPVITQDTKVVATPSTGTGNFSAPITNLSANQTYYARSYIVTSQGTFYGNTISFTTLNVAAASTTQASNISTSGATLEGVAVADGGSPISERGFVYATTNQPVVGQDTKVVADLGNGTGNFNAPVTNLSASTTYYARAYIVNAQGVVYGNTISFQTLPKASSGGGGGGSSSTPVVTPTKVTPTIIDPVTGKTETKTTLMQVIGPDLKASGQLVDASGKVVDANVALNTDGSFTVPATLPAGSYSMIVQIAAPNGQMLAGTSAKLKVDNQGGATMTYDLVDPYGTIKDEVTGQPISGIKLQIYWADTELNRSKGRTPNTLVDLPELPKFMPNQNHVPQWSTANGEYGWMVFGNGDYYILAQRDGYAPYDSRQDTRSEQHGADSYVKNGIIHVGSEIVNYDFNLKPNVASVVREPYMRGYPDGKFYPERGLSRAELAAILTRVLAQNAPSQADIAFKDIASTKWANKSIHTSTEQGWLKGYPGNKFQPARAVTRAEFAQVLANISQWNMDENATITFKDVKKHWASDAIAKAVNHQMLSGSADGLFHPNDPITRSDAITAFNLLFNRQPAAQMVAPVWPDVPTSYPNYANIMEASVRQTTESSQP
ncbi:S-layer homology domain-containing protein [Paenibacillus wenxiniae]|uniref:S-layer homology domain-containing protein n=1 Tax=Paenibacillus wenxiniae TaxID=1636843 RepID=A0ABW4RN66_9BACL